MKKSMTKCENGHFYNGNKYRYCPFCRDTGEVWDRLEARTEPFTASFAPAGSGGAPFDASLNMMSDLYGPPVFERPNGGEILGGTQSDNTVFGSANNTGDDPTGRQRKETMQKTVSFFAQTGVKQPPAVGLLLCVEGGNFGQTYLLKSGKNFIGRSSSMDVVISEDQSVSREKHAIVLYEPKKRMFLAQPGESSELFYINDEVVLQAEALTIYDEITLGSTKLIFIPICCEQFAWDDYTK